MKRCNGSGWPARKTTGMAGTCPTCGMLVGLRPAIINADRFVLVDHVDVRRRIAWAQLTLPGLEATP